MAKLHYQQAFTDILNEQFNSSTYSDLKNVSCEFESGMLMLRGVVSSYFHKQLAQQVALNFSDNLNVNNQLVVRKGSSKHQQ